MQMAEDGGDNMVEDDLFVSDEDELSEAEEDVFGESPIRVKKRNASAFRSARRKSVDDKTRKRASSRSRTKSSSSGEVFSFDSLSSSSEGVRRRGRPVKVIEVSSSLVSPASTKKSPKAKRPESIRRGPGRPRKATSIPAGMQSPGDALESPFSNPGPEDSANRKPGARRSRNSRVQTLVTSPKSTDKGKAKASDAVKTFSTEGPAAALAIVKEGIRFGAKTSSESHLSRSSAFTDTGGRPSKSPTPSPSDKVAKRKPGRPRKSGSPSLPSGNSQFRDSNDVEISEITPTRRRGRPRIDSERPESSRIGGRLRKNDVSTIIEPKRDALATTSPSELKKRGRPRKDVSPALANAATPQISIPSRARGRPKAVVVISSSDSPTPERRRGRPRNDASASTPPETSRRGRPRGSSVLTPSPKNEIANKRKPRKEATPLSPVVRTKQKRGRPCKAAGLVPSAQSETSAFSSKMRMHTKSVTEVDTSSGESFDFAGLDGSEASDEDFDQFLARVAKRVVPKSQKDSERRVGKSPAGKRHVRDVGSQRVWEENHLRRAMSSLSLATPADPAIIISD